MYKVLIVEDELIIQKGIHFKVDWLTHNCVVVGTASNGQEGIELIQKLQPDIVISDIRMPFVNGIELIQQTKEQFKYEAIIISGYSDFEYAKKGIQLGVVDFILKPIHYDELNAALIKITKKLDEKANVKSSNLEQIQTLIELPEFHGQTRDMKYVKEMIDYIQSHYAEKISIHDLSEKLHTSHTTLHTKFKKATNYTFNDFLNRYRIMKAIEFMHEEHTLIYEVASKVGFIDYKYFSQVFKKYTGYSPSQFA